MTAQSGWWLTRQPELGYLWGVIQPQLLSRVCRAVLQPPYSFHGTPNRPARECRRGLQTETSLLQSARKSLIPLEREMTSFTAKCLNCAGTRRTLTPLCRNPTGPMTQEVLSILVAHATRPKPPTERVFEVVNPDVVKSRA